MKQGKKPTLAHKKLIEKAGLNAAEWLVSKETPKELLVVHRWIKSVKIIDKEAYKRW